MSMEDFENGLKQTLERLLARDRGTPRNLAEAVRYSLLSSGKRIRPRLTLACAEMVGLPEAAALPAAIALEMIHCFTLIHDDLPCMDNDDFRRGRPSNHKVHGEALALLAGDALVPLAMEALSEAMPHVQATAFARALKRFCWAAGPRGVIGGQAAEMLLDSQSSLDDLRRMHEGKTGALFAAALLVPADLAGIHESDAKGRAIHDFALELGFAFQVADDLADAEQDRGRPITILAHMSEDDARNIALQGLDRVSTALLQTWGEGSSRTLLEITDQVRKSLAKR